MLKYARPLKTPYNVKEVKCKRLYIVWFNLYEISTRGRQIHTDRKYISGCHGLEAWENGGYCTWVQGFFFGMIKCSVIV